MPGLQTALELDEQRRRPVRFDPIADPQFIFPEEGPSEFQKGLQRGFVTQGTGVLGAAEQAGVAAGSESLQQAARAGFEAQQPRLQELAPRVASFRDITNLFDDPDAFIRDTGDFVSGLFGELVAPAATSGAGALTGFAVGGPVGGLVGALTASSVPSSGHSFKEIEKETGQQRPGLAAATGLTVGALDVLPQVRGLRRAQQVIDNPAAGSALADIAKQIGEESSTEAAQRVVELGGLQVADPEREFFTTENLNDVIDNAVAGGIGGLGFGVGSSVVTAPARLANGKPAPKSETGDARFNLGPESEFDQQREDALFNSAKSILDQVEAGELDIEKAREQLVSLAQGSGFAKTTQGAQDVLSEGFSQRTKDEAVGEAGVDLSVEDALFFNSQVNDPLADETTFEFNRTGEVFQSPELDEVLHGQKFPESSLVKKLEKLRAANDGFVYRPVSVREALAETARQQFDDPVQQAKFLDDAARKKFASVVKKNPKFEQVFDPDDPAKFLDNFQVIERKPVSPIAGPAPLSLSERDFKPTLPAGEQRRLTQLRAEAKKPGGEAAGREAKAIERGLENKRLFRDVPKNGGLRSRREFQVSIDGKRKNLNVQNLVRKFLPQDQPITTDSLAQALFDGLSSLQNTEQHQQFETIDFGVSNGLQDSSIIFTDATNKRVYTYGELRNRGRPRFEAQQAETLRQISDIEREQTDLQGQLREVKKADQIEGIQARIKANDERLASLQQQSASQQQNLDKGLQTDEARANRTIIRGARVIREAEAAGNTQRAEFARSRVAAAKDFLEQGRARRVEREFKRNQEFEKKSETDLDSDRVEEGRRPEFIEPLKSGQIGKVPFSGVDERPTTFKSREDQVTDPRLTELDRFVQEVGQGADKVDAALATKAAKVLGRTVRQGSSRSELLRQIGIARATLIKQELEGSDVVLTDQENALRRAAEIGEGARRVKEKAAETRAKEKQKQEAKEFQGKFPKTPTPTVGKEFGQRRVKEGSRIEENRDLNDADPNARFFDQRPIGEIDQKSFRDRVQQKVKDFLLGVPIGKNIEVITFDQAIELALQQLNPDVAARLGNVSGRGFAFFDADGSVKLYINPRIVNEELLNSVLAHELGHIIKSDIFKRQPKAVQKAVFAEFTAWLEANNVDTKTLREVLESKKTKIEGLVDLLSQKGSPALGDVDPAVLEYATSFEEWFADKTAQFLVDKPRKPKGRVEAFFSLVAKAFKRLFSNQVNFEGSIFDFLDTIIDRSAFWDNRVSPFELIDLERQDRTIGKTPKEILKRIQSVTGVKLSAQWLADLAALSIHDANGAAFNEALRRLSNEPGFFTEAERAILGRAAQAGHVQRQLRRLLASEPRALEQLNDPDAAAAYMFQFWANDLISLGPKAQSTFQKLDQKIRNTLGIISDASNADAIFENLASGAILARAQHKGQFVVERYVKNSIADKVNKRLGPLYRRLHKPMTTVFGMADTRLRETGNPVFIRLARTLNLKAGESANRGTFFTDRIQQVGIFNHRINQITKNLGKTELEGVVEILNRPELFKDGLPHIQKAVRETQKLLRGVRDYMEEAGVKIGDRGEAYFPWVLDTKTLKVLGGEFVEFLNRDKFKKGRIEAAFDINLAVLKRARAQLKTKGSNKDLSDIARDWAKKGYSDALFDYGPFTDQLVHEADFAQAVLNQALDNQGYVDADVDTSPQTQAPSMRFANKRLLAFVEELGNNDDRALLSQFLSHDLGHILSSYVMQGTKRAEYARRYGANGSKLNDMMEEAVARYGASQDDVNFAFAYLRAVMGLHGRESAEFLAKKLNIKPPPSNQPIDPRLQRAIGAVTLYQNIRTLFLSSFSAITDSIGVGVRSGDFGLMVKSFTQSVGQVLKPLDKRDLVDMASLLGAIDQQMGAEALRWEHGGIYNAGFIRTLNDGFFKAIGVDALTRGARLVAVAGAQNFLKRHAQRPNRHSRRYFEDLGLQAEDVTFRKDGRVKLLTFQERAALRDKPEELARDDRVRRAMNQFVDEAIIRPNASQRPLWASDPHLSLVFHLKSFMYSFHDTVVRRVSHETQSGNYLPLMQLSLFIPAFVASDLLRDRVKGNDGRRFRHWDLLDFIDHGAYRGQLYGISGTLSYEALQDYKHGRFPGRSILPPTLESVTDTVSALAA